MVKYVIRGTDGKYAVCLRSTRDVLWVSSDKLCQTFDTAEQAKEEAALFHLRKITVVPHSLSAHDLYGRKEFSESVK